MTKKKFDNDAWIKDHFESLVDKYSRKYSYILVAGGRVFPLKPGENVAKLEEKIRRKYGKPIGMPVPQPQDFHSILLVKSCKAR